MQLKKVLNEDEIRKRQQQKDAKWVTSYVPTIKKNKKDCFNLSNFVTFCKKLRQTLKLNLNTDKTIARSTSTFCLYILFACVNSQWDARHEDGNEQYANAHDGDGHGCWRSSGRASSRSFRLFYLTPSASDQSYA